MVAKKTGYLKYIDNLEQEKTGYEKKKSYIISGFGCYSCMYGCMFRTIKGKINPR